MHIVKLSFVLALFCVGNFAMAASAAETVPENASQLQLSYAPIVKKTAPAVVNVFAKSKGGEGEGDSPFDDPFFRQFFGPGGGFGQRQEQMQNSLGSGVIVGTKGLIVTNNHVIKGGTDIRVVLADKREFPAKILLSEERSDLAVLKIDVGEEKLSALKMGDSDELEVGDLVLAIGNPFGVGQTVTSGIVSALARTDVGITDYQFFIQTDAAINPGNSGGALVNMKGELVGINTAIFSRSGGSIGIGFSIPSNMVKTVVEQAEKGGKIRRPWIGAELQDVSPEIADSLSLSRPEGALIASLQTASPLEKAGLKRGDVILAVDGRTIESAQAFNYRLATVGVGHKVVVEYLRGGKQAQLSVELSAAPETVERKETTIETKGPLQGLVVANLSPAVADELGLTATVTGVVAVDVGRATAQRFFSNGDVISSVNGVEVHSVEELLKVLTEVPSSWSIEINRDGQYLELTLR